MLERPTPNHRTRSLPQHHRSPCASLVTRCDPPDLGPPVCWYLYQALPYTRAADLPGAPEPFTQVAAVSTLLQQRESHRAVRQFTQADRLLQVGFHVHARATCVSSAVLSQKGGT